MRLWLGRPTAWHESALPLGGEGCPEVAEFAVVEFAAALGRSTESGRRYLSHAVEGFYRLRRCWGRLEAGELPAWRLGFIAERTLCLSPGGGRRSWTSHVAPVAHKIGPAQLDRLIDEAKARFDPDQTEADRLAAAEAGHFDIRLGRRRGRGPGHVDGDVDLADALDLEAAVAADAHHQLLLGSTESLDVRRAIAIGNLARAQQTLDLTSAAAHEKSRPRRQVVLHVHLEHAAVLGAGGLARLQETGGPVTAAQVRQWCANPDAQITVQPVLDLAEHIHVGSYEASARLKLQTRLRDGTCAFPFCFRPAEHCDCEHRVPHDGGGPTCSCNLAPCCRRHTGEDHRRLDLPDRRARRLPVAQPAGLPVPPRPHRHPRRHPRPRTPPTRPRPSPPTSAPRPRTLTTPPHTPLRATRAGASACAHGGALAASPVSGQTRSEHGRSEVRIG